MKHYQKLVEKVKEISLIGNAISVLGWDQETYMPRLGAEARAKQISLLTSIHHEKLVSHETEDLINNCISNDKLNETQRLLIREVKRDRDREIKIPSSLVKKLSETSSKAFESWIKAKKASCFSIFEPVLGEMINLCEEKANHLEYPKDGKPYDALLDIHETGASDITAGLARNSTLHTLKIGGA